MLAHNRFKSLDFFDGAPQSAQQLRRARLVPQQSFDTVTSTATGGAGGSQGVGVEVGNDFRLQSTWSNSTSMESNIVTVNENTSATKNDDIFMGGIGLRRGISSGCVGSDNSKNLFFFFLKYSPKCISSLIQWRYIKFL